MTKNLSVLLPSFIYLLLLHFFKDRERPKEREKERAKYRNMAGGSVVEVLCYSFTSSHGEPRFAAGRRDKDGRLGFFSTPEFQF